MQLCFVVPLYCRPYGGTVKHCCYLKTTPQIAFLSDSMHSISMYSISMYSIYQSQSCTVVYSCLTQSILSQNPPPHSVYSCLTLALLWRPAHPLSRIMVEVPVMVVGSSFAHWQFTATTVNALWQCSVTKINGGQRPPSDSSVSVNTVLVLVLILEYSAGLHC